MPHSVFMTGGTGYMGQRLITLLRKRGHEVKALVRAGSEKELPYAILPIYWILEKIPATKESAQRLGLVTIDQMLSALVWAIENPPTATRVLDVPRIRELSRSFSALRSK